MKKIPLTKNKVAIVDDEDFEWLSKYKWRAEKKAQTFYAVRSSKVINHKRISIKMHRLILKIEDRKIKCDHINRNGLDNQKHNLRIATSSQNNSNRMSRPGSTSKYLGVCWNKSRRKWQANISKNGRTFYLGLYDLEIDAAKKYNEMAPKIHGEFANLNKI